MKVLQIILFLIGNVVFLAQIGRHAHQIFFGTEHSIVEQYESDFSERERAKAQKNEAVLLEEYRLANETVRALEKGVKSDAQSDLRREHTEEYDLRNSLRNELQERERRQRELRDVWLYSLFGLALIGAGAVTYFRGAYWAGFAVLVTGFIEMEYWASPTFFGGAADAEFRVLLINKFIISLIAFVLLQGFWALQFKGLNRSVPARSGGRRS